VVWLRLLLVWMMVDAGGRLLLSPPTRHTEKSCLYVCDVHGMSEEGTAGP
jgi:hypothetical protein